MTDLLCPLEVGNPVIHTITKLCGTIEAVEHHSTSSRQLLTVHLLNGKYMRGIPREEFRLHTAGPAEREAQCGHIDLGGEAGEAFDNDGRLRDRPVSEESILGELC
jgi:hypothetical protein